MTESKGAGLRVIGAGWGRTGTSSLKRALETLGFGPCHHMEEVIKNPKDVPEWERASCGETIDWKAFMEPWGACVDFPSSLYYRELMEAFPEAKVVLSVRDPESWYASMAVTIVPMMMRFPISILGRHLPFIGAPQRVMISTPMFPLIMRRFEEREHVLQAFRDHIEDVKQNVPAERLLVFEAKEGWAPLCAFLGVPAPSEPFPRVNDSAAFKKRVLAVTVFCWFLLLAPLSPVAVLLSLLF